MRRKRARPNRRPRFYSNNITQKPCQKGIPPKSGIPFLLSDRLPCAMARSAAGIAPAAAAVAATAAALLSSLCTFAAFTGGALRALGSSVAFKGGFAGLTGSLASFLGRLAGLAGSGLAPLNGAAEVGHAFAGVVFSRAAGAAAASGRAGIRAADVPPQRIGVFTVRLTEAEDIRRHSARGAGIPRRRGHPVNVHGSPTAVGDGFTGRFPQGRALAAARAAARAAAGRWVPSVHGIHLPSQSRLCCEGCICYPDSTRFPLAKKAHQIR